MDPKLAGRSNESLDEQAVPSRYPLSFLLASLSKRTILQIPPFLRFPAPTSVPF